MNQKLKRLFLTILGSIFIFQLAGSLPDIFIAKSASFRSLLYASQVSRSSSDDDHREHLNADESGISTCLPAPSSCTWERTYGGLMEDKAYDVHSLSDNGVLVIGNSRSFGGSSYKAWILRLDRTGNKIWDKKLGGPGNNQVYGVTETKNGDLVTVGHTNSVGKGKSDAWISRLDNRGELIWERTFGGEKNDRARTVAADRNGIVVGGTMFSFPAGREGNGWLAKYDQDGKIEWQRVFIKNENSGIFNISINKKGDVFAVGFTGSDNRTGYDLWIVKLNKKGSILWQKQFSEGLFNSGTGVVETKSGGLFIVGISSEDAFRKDRAWILNLNKKGEVIWQRFINGPKPEKAWAVLALPDESYVVSVASESVGSGSTDARLICFSQKGDILWERVYGGNLWDRPTSIDRANDGSIWMGGYTTSQGSGFEDYWILRLSFDGRL